MRLHEGPYPRGDDQIHEFHLHFTISLNDSKRGHALMKMPRFNELHLLLEIPVVRGSA